LRNVEARARQVGAALTNGAQAATSALGKEFERVRATAGEETERTVTALQAVCEQVASETAQALGSTTDTFRDVSGELRAMMAQIQGELESTRAELRRTMVALPEETQATAAQMRRVVGDQIKALNELATLVSGSGRAVDALPATQRTPAKAGPELRSISSSPATPHLTSVPPAARAQNEPAPVQTPQGALETSAPDRARPRRDEPEGAVPRSGNGHGGWISEVMLRSSHEKPAPEPRNNGGSANPLASLTSIAGNISQMFDHETVTEAWDRHRRGERNAFTRRLYTPQGQQMFDEIRRKYQRDPEFRGAVDHYVREFESLLAKVSRNSRDPSLEGNYLTSEPGKVYTMLAHASGHFENG
jgi:hypothetical protein